MTSESDSFAHKTMTTRIPAIVKQVLADHTYPAGIQQNLQTLYAEITQNQSVQPLETQGPDGPAWQAAWQPYQGRGWLDIPWYFAEAFFYRRLLEATGFFGKHGPTYDRADPFKPRKEAELKDRTPWQVLLAAVQQSTDNSADSLRALLHYCVWGNRVDLSYSQVAEETGRAVQVQQEQQNLLVDDTKAVVAYLRPKRQTMTELQVELIPGLRTLTPQSCIDFICDNTGTELLMDLALVDFLLRFNYAKQITLHVKAHPTFVSDAVPKDVEVATYATMVHPTPELAALGTRLEEFIAEKRLVTQPDLFWNSSQFFWQLPDRLTAWLSHAQIVFIKGDANYRRLLGDSRWATTVPTAKAIPYFPAPFVALRTLKSDPIVGLLPGQAEALDKADPTWRVNGKRGVVQAVLG